VSPELWLLKGWYVAITALHSDFALLFILVCLLELALYPISASKIVISKIPLLPVRIALPLCSAQTSATINKYASKIHAAQAMIACFKHIHIIAN
jgi:hypothetical protein